jgi:predicted nucleic acid-binding protein
MGQYYFDTSALVKRYRPERGTADVDRLISERGSSFCISRLTIIETVSALALKVRSRALSIDVYAAIRKMFLSEVVEGTLQVARLLVTHYRNAERLVDQHGTTRRIRTLDALQLSIALDLYEKDVIDHFVGADEVLCEIASLEGLRFVNPALAAS